MDKKSTTGLGNILEKDKYELEFKCKNCYLVKFYAIPKGIGMTYHYFVCDFCGCQELEFTGNRKEEVKIPF